MEDRRLLTRTELVSNRLLAVLLILSAPLLLFSIFTIPTVVIFILFALFLFFSKRYHSAINVFFLLIATGVYLLPLPIGWGLFLALREWRMGGFIFHPIIIFFYLSPLLFISLATRNFLGSILLFFKPNPVWRNRLFFIFLATVMITILAYPLLSSYKLRHRAMENSTGNSALSMAIVKQELKVEVGKGASSTALARKTYTASFDPAINKYIYRLKLVDPLESQLTFTAVKADGEKINFINDPRVECLNCQINNNDPYGLVFPAGQGVDFMISSDQFIKTIKFTELEGSLAEFVFWK
ncbi:MAG: hypothetical protein NT052_01385 [Candidatus Shapirobacteria bacterium]|nr:hypothetical protein [Candidatus Shapirobacteria bacterium]